MNKIDNIVCYDEYGDAIGMMKADACTSIRLESLTHALGQIGISVNEATEAIRRMNEVLQRLNYVEEAAYSTQATVSKNSCDIDALRNDTNLLRSEMDAKTEDLKLKIDSEIFRPISTIEADPDFQSLRGNIFLEALN